MATLFAEAHKEHFPNLISLVDPDTPVGGKIWIGILTVSPISTNVHLQLLIHLQSNCNHNQLEASVLSYSDNNAFYYL